MAAWRWVVVLGVALAPAALVSPGLGQVAPVVHRGVARSYGGPDAGVPVRGPWLARRRQGVLVHDEVDPTTWIASALDTRRLRNLGVRGGPRTRIAPSRWPREPDVPRESNPGRFTRALRRLCPQSLPAPRAESIAHATLESAERFGVDPFVLAALVYQQSACGTLPPDSWGLGLARVNLGVLETRWRSGAYHYGLARQGGGYRTATLPMGKYPLTKRALRADAPNLYFAAGLLRVFHDQCPGIDAPFASAPHRHAVSHFVWGDHVRSALSENLILTARRRLLAYYADAGTRRRAPARRARYRSLVLVSPLDGAPRIVIGVMGDPRPKRRVHAGVDLLADTGEPVRAMADGTVVFAGADLKKRGLQTIEPERVLRVPHDRMGARGLFVRIDHGHGIHTLYVHLSQYPVRTGQRVQQGEVIGYVGRTGMHTSDAHLHLGLFDGDSVVDPLPWLAPFVIAGDEVPVTDFMTQLTTPTLPAR